MKVCLLTRDFSLDGGIGRVSSEIRNRLEELGHEVYSVSSDSMGQLVILGTSLLASERRYLRGTISITLLLLWKVYGYQRIRAL